METKMKVFLGVLVGAFVISYMTYILFWQAEGFAKDMSYIQFWKFIISS